MNYIFKFLRRGNIKKVLFLFFILSAVSFSRSEFEISEDILENYFDIKYSIISDGVNQINNIDYDLTISQNKALLELEIESVLGDANWSKLDKQVFEDIILELVNVIRAEVNNSNLGVAVFVKLDFYSFMEATVKLLFL